jgi:DNA-binding MarR family transcriptional regulator
MSSRGTAIAAWEALFRAQVAVMRDLSREFPTDQVSLNEYDVLFNLSRSPDRRARLRDLNRQLLMSQPSLSRLIDRLVARDLVEKCVAPDDGRGIIVALTDAGYSLFRTVGTRHASAIAKRVGAALDDDELEALRALSDRLRDGAPRETAAGDGATGGAAALPP